MIATAELHGTEFECNYTQCHMDTDSDIIVIILCARINDATKS